MDKRQKEAFVIVMLEKGESYRDIAQKAKVLPNTNKAISNRAGHTSCFWDAMNPSIP
jgi:hypothetical protein